MTLRDQMAALMPGLRWTRPMACVAVGKLGTAYVARVYHDDVGGEYIVTLHNAAWQGTCQSPAHAAKTIRRKLREFVVIFEKALEETT